MPIAIVDGRISEACERGLMLRGFQIIKTVKNTDIGEAVSYHPDMLMFSHGNTVITSVYYAEYAESIFSDIRYFSADSKVRFVDEVQREKYPYDAIFNALVIGKRIFCKTDSVSEAVLEYAKCEGLEVVHVSQGYPACTVLAISESAAITADRGMCEVLSSSGIKVTLIENGDMLLPPYEYGFIGGAAGVFGDTVYFLGDVTKHRDYEKIRTACEGEGKRIVSLSSEGLIDLGRILFLP